MKHVTEISLYSSRYNVIFKLILINSSIKASTTYCKYEQCETPLVSGCGTHQLKIAFLRRGPKQYWSLTCMLYTSEARRVETYNNGQQGLDGTFIQVGIDVISYRLYMMWTVINDTRKIAL